MNKKSVLFIVGAILASALLFGVYFLSSMKGEQVVITVHGKEYGTYDLNKNQTIRVDIDGDYNVIEIKDGTVDVTESNCDNQICVMDYPISKDTPGVIVCLPHDLIVEIKE